MDQSIIITRPDKGKDVVLLNTKHYTLNTKQKMEHLLQDSSKFQKVETVLPKAVMIYDDRNNRLTQQFFKDKLIGEATRDAIRATGSRPAIMYDLPKVHKSDTPLRHKYCYLVSEI